MSWPSKPGYQCQILVLLNTFYFSNFSLTLGLNRFKTICKLLFITIHKLLVLYASRHSIYPKAIQKLNKNVQYRNINLLSVVVLS